MDVKSSLAAAAYAAAQAKGGAGVKAGGAVEAGEGASFAGLMKEALSGSMEAARQGEAASLQAVVNPTNLSEVVTAVSNAEITLHTVIAVRDRVIQAYLDVLKMPI